MSDGPMNLDSDLSSEPRPEAPEPVDVVLPCCLSDYERESDSESSSGGSDWSSSSGSASTLQWGVGTSAVQLLTAVPMVSPCSRVIDSRRESRGGVYGDTDVDGAVIYAGFNSRVVTLTVHQWPPEFIPEALNDASP